MLRGLIIAASGYTTRREQLDGREYLVLPVVGLVEGVVHAMNARQPEFVPASEFSRAPHAWNGRPLFYGHPTLHGHAISGNTPDVLERACVGKVFGANVKNKKLGLEAWLDVDAAKTKAPELLARAEAGDPFEVSVGVFVSTDDSTGEHMGKKWLGAWSDLNPDHLAILPPGIPGACSREMGCGVRAAAAGEDLNAWSEETGVLRAAWPDKSGYDDHGRGAAADAHEAAAKAHDAAAKAHGNLVGKNSETSDKASYAAVKISKDASKATNSANRLHEKTADPKASLSKDAEHYHANDKAGTRAIRAEEKAQAFNHTAARDYHRQAAEQHRLAAAQLRVRHAEDGSELRDAYSPDQERDEKGRFAAGASAHEAAATLHHDAASGHQQKDAGAAAASKAAERGTHEANKTSGKLPIGAHGLKAGVHARAASEHARNGDHKAAAHQHKEAAGSHDQLAELIRKAGELHDKLRHAEESDMETTWAEERHRFEACRDITAEARKKIPSSDFAEPPDGFPIVEPIDVHDAALAIGRAKDNPSTVKGRIISIAYRKGADFVAQLPDAWKKTSDQKNASGFARFMATVREKLGIMPDDVTPETERELRAAYSIDKPTAAGAPCGCKHGNAPTTEQEIEMTREEMQKFLEKATPEQLKALSVAAGEKPTEAELKAAADAKALADKTALEAKEKADKDAAEALRIANDKNAAAMKAAVDAGIAALTFDQVMAKATPDVRAAVNAGQKAAKARKDATIKALMDTKRGGYTAEQLGAKSQEELDQLAALASVPTESGIDFTIGGAPRQQLGAAEQAVAAPPSLNERILAGRAKK